MSKTKAEQRQQLFRLCQRFIQDNQITCGESIWQSDDVMENAQDLIEKMCEIVGYLEDKE